MTPPEGPAEMGPADLPRTLLISEVFPPRVGGSGRFMWEVYRRWPRDRVAIVAGQGPGQEEFDRAHDRRVVRLPLTLPDWGMASLRGLRGYWRAARAVRAVLASAEVDQIHCARCLPEGWIALLLGRPAGLPFVCYAHGEEVKLRGRGPGHGVLSSRQLRWMTRAVLRSAAMVVANSRNTARILREEWGLPAGRVRLLHPGVDTRRFRPAPRDEAARSRLGWGGRRVVLTVARLQGRKGHDRMIAALPAIRRRLPDVLYAIAGDGEERGPLEALVAASGLAGYVQFLGEVGEDRLVDCYQQCDLFVLPNRQVGEDIEGFGMVLLEAQACGRPVVAGASGGTAETMRIPETGRTVCCDDGPDELAGVVAELLGDAGRLERMGAAGRRWVVDQFDWEAVGGRARDLFRPGPPGPGDVG